MADIVNLRRFRKDKARAVKEAQATENRVRFGRTKSERQSAGTEKEMSLRSIEGHRLGPDDAATASERQSKKPPEKSPTKPPTKPR